jgi:cell division protease FtsH
MFFLFFIIQSLCIWNGGALRNYKINAYRPLIENKVASSFTRRAYPISPRYYEESIKRLNSRNSSIQNNEILNYLSMRNRYNGTAFELYSGHPEDYDDEEQLFENLKNLALNGTNGKEREFSIIINRGDGIFGEIEFEFNTPIDEKDDELENENEAHNQKPQRYMGRKWGSSSGGGSGTSSYANRKSDNFEVIDSCEISFKDVGGYDYIKLELDQCIDILKNYTKYSKYNIRVPKGLIFEGPPGNGKTLLAKALAGEAKTGFIAVSGSEFQDKYVGVGASRVRELFALAKKNVPCIIFIDEIDALGRSRGSDNEMASAERDNTLNELLVSLDGFKNSSGIFVIGATNRADLLDKALLRPGRIDKRIFIANPDEKTRRAIIEIHSRGKPRVSTIHMDDLVEMTAGFSGAQIENILNEAMLNALRYDRTATTLEDIDVVINKVMAGWQPNEHQFTSDIIDHIAVHELGHAILGLLSKHHTKMSKVIINLYSPKSPAYTVFESSTSSIYTREGLFEHLMILLGGRIAEEIIYGVSVTTGAINDFKEAKELAEKMITYYGLGKNVIYPDTSEKYRQKIDDDVADIINEAYGYSKMYLEKARDMILEGSALLKKEKTVKAEKLIEMMETKYPELLDLHH